MLQVGKHQLRRATHLAISTFLLFHLIVITCWCVPLDWALIRKVRDVVHPYMIWSGLFQGWDMFAPSPRSVNAHVEAAVILRDGQTRAWRFPRMEQLSLPERYYKERYRKFVENLEPDRNAPVWPDVARHIARFYGGDASNPPEIVMLIRYWSDIAPPSDRPYQPTRERARIFFEYNVKPEDLK